MQSFFSSGPGRLLGSLLLFMLVLALGSYAQVNFEKVQHLDPDPARITVTGEGEVLAVPDIGKFSFSVTAEAADAQAAQEASGTKVNDILAYLREQGIAETDIKVEYYNLYPRYRWEERVCPAGSYCPPGERVQDGFEVTQSVSVKIRETAKAPGIIAGVGEHGATNISNLSFTVDDTDALRAEARALAITDAQEQAAVLARQLGVRLVRLAGFNEYGDQPMYDTYLRSAAMETAEGAGFGGAELPVGEESTVVRVNLTYEVE